MIEDFDFQLNLFVYSSIKIQKKKITNCIQVQ
jgi:hypothetical protein